MSGWRRGVASGGWLVVQTRSVTANLGDFSLRLDCQLCRRRRCSPFLLRHSACLLLVSLLFSRGVSPSSACSSLTTCTHAPVRTSAPRPEEALPKPKPLSTKHLPTTSLTTFASSARASARLASSSSSSSWEFLSPASPASRLPRPF